MGKYIDQAMAIPTNRDGKGLPMQDHGINEALYVGN